MNNIFSNIISAIVGAIFGALGHVLLGEPLRKLISGERKAEKEKKNREINKENIIDYMIQRLDNGESTIPTTIKIREKLFPNKSKKEIYNLLRELKNEGKIKSFPPTGKNQDIIGNTEWLYKINP